MHQMVVFPFGLAGDTCQKFPLADRNFMEFNQRKCKSTEHGEK